MTDKNTVSDCGTQKKILTGLFLQNQDISVHQTAANLDISTVVEVAFRNVLCWQHQKDEGQLQALN